MAPPLERAINELSKLPSIGKKTAQRLAFHILKSPAEDAAVLAEAIRSEGGRHLVVGHSDTTPELVELLGGDVKLKIGPHR